MSLARTAKLITQVADLLSCTTGAIHAPILPPYPALHRWGWSDGYKANAEPVPSHTEHFDTPETPDAESFRKSSASSAAPKQESTDWSSELAELRKENFDLKITNRGKDYFIDQMKIERETLLKQLVDSSQRLGQLENKLLQLQTGSE